MRRTTVRKKTKNQKMKLFAQAVRDTKGKTACRFERIFQLKCKTWNAVLGLWSLPHPHGPCTDIQSFQQSADARLPRHKSRAYRAASSIARSHFALPVPAPSLGAEYKEYWDQLGMRPSHRPLTSFSYWHQLKVRQFQFINTQNYSRSRDASIPNIS